MIQRFKVRSFLTNKQGISEEYTTLPALSVVMIGFSLFLILLAQTYAIYQERMTQLHFYQIADYIIEKFTNPECCVMKSGGLLDISLLNNTPDLLKPLRDEYHPSNISFILRLHYNNDVCDYPEPLPNMTKNRIAVSKELGVYLNEAQITPGTLTVILWETIP
jgi:hypothetical protein